MLPFRPRQTPSGFDRAAALRRDAAHVRRLTQASNRKLFPLWRNLQPIAADGTPLDVACEEPEESFVFLGLKDGAPCFAVDLPVLGTEPPPLAGGRWGELRGLWPLLKQEDADLLAYVRSLLGWHRRHRHCGVCGGKTAVQEGGHQRLCLDPACAAVHFPRTDPAVLMLITDRDGQALLARQPSWPKGMLSALSGFVEPGESLEQAVVRETLEEVGIQIDSLCYVVSQPWPFPSSLMAAFEAEVQSGAVPRVDRTELEGAWWFARDEVRAFGEPPHETGGWALPRRGTVSRLLIERWLGRE